MASEPLHFIIENATWTANEATLGSECTVTPILDYVICTRQDVVDDTLAQFRAIPGVIEVTDITQWKQDNPSYFPVES